VGILWLFWLFFTQLNVSKSWFVISCALLLSENVSSLNMLKHHTDVCLSL